MKHPSLLFSLPADIFCRVCIPGIWRHFPNRIPSGICRMRRNSIGRKHREKLCSDGFRYILEKAFRFPQMPESRNSCRAVRGGKSERKFSLPPVPQMLRIPAAKPHPAEFLQDRKRDRAAEKRNLNFCLKFHRILSIAVCSEYLSKQISLLVFLFAFFLIQYITE